MSRELTIVRFHFSDDSVVEWKYIGLEKRVYKLERKFHITVRVEASLVRQSIDQYFDTWDKPSQRRAAYFIKRVIKEVGRI